MASRWRPAACSTATDITLDVPGAVRQSLLRRARRPRPQRRSNDGQAILRSLWIDQICISDMKSLFSWDLVAHSRELRPRIRRAGRRRASAGAYRRRPPRPDRLRARPGCRAHGQDQHSQPGEDDRGDDAGDVQAGGERLPRGVQQFRALAGGKVLAGGDRAGLRGQPAASFPRRHRHHSRSLPAGLRRSPTASDTINRTATPRKPLSCSQRPVIARMPNPPSVSWIASRSR
jgi:hypothetical protein